MAPLVMPLGKGLGDAKQDARRGSDILIVTVEDAYEHYAVGRLRALAGETGSTLWTSDQPGTDTWESPAVGDIDGDGAPEIIWGYPMAQPFLFVLDHAGEPQRVMSDAGHPPICHGVWSNGDWGFPQSISLSDMDHDGRAEILVGRSMVAADLSTWDSGDDSCGYGHSFAADVVGDGTEELLAGHRVFDRLGETVISVDDLTILWDDAAFGIPAVADLDGDGAPDLIAAGPRLTWAFSIATEQLLYYVSDQWRVGPVAVADFDGDGAPEVAGWNGGAAHVLAGDGDEIMTTDYGVGSITAGPRGVVAFDFDGDGASELVVSSGEDMLVLDGVTGAVRLQVEAPQVGPLGAPTIADVDGDGAAEIVVPVAYPDGANGGAGGVRVLESAGKPWPAARGVWNQVQYFRDNVNDDGSIPKVAGKPWLTHNSFRSADARDYPDLLVQPNDWGEGHCEGGKLMVRLRVGNQGRAEASAGARVALYATVRPAPTGPSDEATDDAPPPEREVLLAETALSEAIEPRALSSEVALEVPVTELAQALADDGELLALHATVTAAPSNTEYHTDNNDTAWGLAPCTLP